VNEVIKQLFERKSVRAYEDRDIAQSDKDLIIDAALQAPSAGNQTLYTILDIEDQAIKDALALSCDNQPFIAGAKLVLIFLADCRRWLDCYAHAGAEPRKPGVADLVLACEDALIAAQNAVVAAESLGIGSCYIGDILENQEQHVELLNLDEYVMPVAMLVFGYPTAQQQARRKPRRFDRRDVVQKNAYSRPGEAELRAMFARRHDETAFDFDDFMIKFHKRKYASDFAAEMNRSVQRYLAHFRPDGEDRG
jgi:nitroreductase